MGADPVQFVEFTVDSPLYQMAFELRNQVLREPLGLNLRDDDLSREAESLHFALCHEGAILAYAMIVPGSDRSTVLRQMCVTPQHQGKGYGRQLLETIEQQLRERGERSISMAARVIAVGFYQSLDYQTVGDEFLSVTIPHIRMEKKL